MGGVGGVGGGWGGGLGGGGGGDDFVLLTSNRSFANYKGAYGT